MRKTRNILLYIFFSGIVLSLIIIAVFETFDTLSPFLSATDEQMFLPLVIMELTTICAIPLAMMLFRFKYVKAELTSDSSLAPRRLLKWGTIRLIMLELPMIINTLMYELTLKVANGYMAIILLLSLFFIVPTLERCYFDVTDTVEDSRR